jgi:type I restriction enzyme S subunit
MKEGWEKTKLDDLCQIELGKTPYRGDKSFWDTEKETKNVWLSIADMLNTDGDVVSDSKEYITDKAAKVSKIVKKGTLLLSFKLTLGRLAFAGRDLYTNEAIAALTIKNNKVIDKYFLYQFLSLFDWYAASEGDLKVKGRTLNKAKLKEIEVDFPRFLPEQQRIVSIIDKAFEAIDKAIENTQKNLQNAKELFESYLNNVFENGGDEKKLEDLSFLISKGSSPKWQGIKYVDEPGVLFVTSENVGENELLLEKRKYVEEKFNISDKKSILKNGDVLTNIVGASIGRTAIFNLDEIANINQAVCLIRCNPHLLLNEYLMFILNSPFTKQHLHDNEVNSARANLSLGFFRSLYIPAPNLARQKEIVDEIKVLHFKTDRLESKYQQKLRDLEELKKSVLNKAFAGEL